MLHHLQWAQFQDKTHLTYDLGPLDSWLHFCKWPERLFTPTPADWTYHLPKDSGTHLYLASSSSLSLPAPCNSLFPVGIPVILYPVGFFCLSLSLICLRARLLPLPPLNSLGGDTLSVLVLILAGCLHSSTQSTASSLVELCLANSTCASTSLLFTENA